jgi:membrane-bound serine protease (ClpP class)
LARRLAGALLFGLGSHLVVAQTHEVPVGASAAVVYAAEVDSIIHPVSAEYMIATMDRADRAGATLVVFTLRTPGGLVDSTRDIITHMLASKTPVAVFIGPSGARAASAGFILTIAADVAAMAPGTHIGAAHPVAGGGQQATSQRRARRGGREQQPRLHRG